MSNLVIRHGRGLPPSTNLAPPEVMESSRYIPMDTPDDGGKGQRDLIRRLNKRITQLEDALRFYADHENYIKTINFHPIIMDNGEIARESLADKGEK